MEAGTGERFMVLCWKDPLEKGKATQFSILAQSQVGLGSFITNKTSGRDGILLSYFKS